MDLPPEDKPPGAPSWIVSFADMITNLLTFFILLNAFANSQQAGFIADGLGSFRDVALKAGGPSHMDGGKIGAVDIGASRVRYRPPDALNPEMLDDVQGDIRDHNRDALRQTVKAALKADRVTRIPVELIFEPAKAELTDAHKKALDIIAPTLREFRVDLRIDGYAYAEPTTEIRDLAVSRANAVRDYLSGVHGIEIGRMFTVGYGSSGIGIEKRANRIIQDRLGRRIAIIYLVPRA